MKSFVSRVESLGRDIRCSKPPLTNRQKRIFYSRNELLILELEAYQRSSSDEDISGLLKILENNRPRLALAHSNPQTNSFLKLISLVEDIYRVAAVAMFLISCSLVLAIPCICFKPLERILVRVKLIGPRLQFSVLCRRAMAAVILCCLGLVVRAEGVEEAFANKAGASILCFSHTSAIDTFVISFLTPVRSYTVGKSELFLIPFFSWLSFAFDGVAIDRNRRENAVLAIEYARLSARDGDVISISPEGTRSGSGQLLPFKKGVFHMWEQLKAPIIPMVIFGPHELRQKGFPWPRHGQIVVRFLPPINPNEASSREEMSQLLRRRMLLAAAHEPNDVCSAESLDHWLAGLATASLIWFVHVQAFSRWIPQWINGIGISVSSALLLFVLVATLISISVYVFAVFVRISVMKAKLTKR